MFQMIAPVGALLLGIFMLLMGSGLLSTLISVRMTIEDFPTTVIGPVIAFYFVGLVAGCVFGRGLILRVGHIRAFAAFASLISAVSLAHAFVVSPYSWALLRATTGFCFAGIFMVAESWLNAKASNETRGAILSYYMITNYLALGAGQFLLNLGDPKTFALFGIVSILVSVALVPVALTRASAPDIGGSSDLHFRRLYRISPLGLVGCFGSGLILGAFYGMGPVFATKAGLDIAEISSFMGTVILGGLVLQWPVGRLSDRFDRRTIILGVTVAIAVISAAAAQTAGTRETALLTLGAVFGGAAYPLYSLCLAHTNDYVEPDRMIEASSGLLIAWGIGAAIGPIAASGVMQLTDHRGLFHFTAATGLALSLFAVYRMARRRAPAAEDQGQYVLLGGTSPVALEMDPRGEFLDDDTADETPVGAQK